MSTSSVDGLISGMNTTQIISQLMQIEAVPQQRLEAKAATVGSQISAYQNINKRFAALQDAAAKLTTVNEWRGRTATSSSDKVAVTADPNVLTGSITFDVQAIAKAQTNVSHGTYSSTSQSVTASSTLAITKSGASPVTVNVGDGSLAAVVSGINAANIGVRAAVVQVGTSSFRLQLSSTTTGAASSFTITDGTDPLNTTPLGTLDELVHGQDATLVVGEDGSPGQYTVTSASNTISDVLPGVTMTVKAPVDGVTIDVQKSSLQVTNDVQDMVDAANAVLNSISAATAYDTKTKKGQPLVGDSTVRELESEVLDIVTLALGGSTANGAAAGIEVDKTGAITFNAGKFQTAFDKDSEGLAKLFRPGGTMAAKDPAYASLTTKISFLAAGDQSAPGSYDVKITQAATQASRQLSGVIAAGEQLTLTSGTKSAVVTAQPGDDLAALAQRINDASATKSLGLTARVESGNLVVRASAYGSAPTFAITTSGTLAVGALVAGHDVAGTINGVVAKGTGQALAAPATDVNLHGLALLVTATDADVTAAAGQVGANQNLFGTFTYAPGLAQKMSSLSADVVRSSTGRLTAAIAGKQSMIDSLTTQINDWDTRLQAKQDQYKQQYASLETALGKLKDQASWLAGQLGSLPTGSSS